MADKHPYMSGSGGLTQLVAQLRRTFPTTVTADTLKKLGIAPNNETYVLNIMRFIGVLDEENKKNPEVGSVFNKHDDNDFQVGFAKLVFDSYHELFNLHGVEAWHLPVDKLVSFFRTNDETSDVVGRRQATTFQTLARIAGKLEEGASVPASKPRVTKNGSQKATKLAADVKRSSPAISAGESPSINAAPRDQTPAGIALTVRIEINLPAGGDQLTYDYIFKSIRENLLNGNGV